MKRRNKENPNESIQADKRRRNTSFDDVWKPLWRRYSEELGLSLVARKLGTFITVDAKTGKTTGNDQPEARVQKVVDRHKQFDMGFFTGADSGYVFVFDVDDPEAFNEYQQKTGVELPWTLSHKTSGKKRHYLYRAPYGSCISSGKLDELGADIIGEGSTAPLPGSIHRKWEGTIIYVAEEAPIADAPEWMLELIHEMNAKKVEGEDIDVDLEDLKEPDWATIEADHPELHRRLTEADGEDRSRDVYSAACEAYRLGLSDLEVVSLLHFSDVGEAYYSAEGKSRNLKSLRQAAGKAKAEVDQENKLHEEDGLDITDLIKVPEAPGKVRRKQPGISIVSNAATRKTLGLLEMYGNVPSEPHRKAIDIIQQTFADLIVGEKKGRYCLPLPAGYGKTTSIVSFIVILSKANIFERPHKRVAVLSTKVEQLCEAYRSLIEAGVPQKYISLVHSYQYDANYCDPGQLPPNYASEEAVLDADRPIVLLTHAKARRDGGKTKSSAGECSDFGFEDITADTDSKTSQYDSYLQDRDLVVWDESFITGDVKSVTLQGIKDQLAVVEARFKERAKNNTEADLTTVVKGTGGDFDTYLVPDFEKERAAIQFMKDCVAVITDTQVKKLTTLDDLPETRPEQRIEHETHLAAIMKEKPKRQRGSKIGDIRAFLRMIGDTVAVYPSGNTDYVLKPIVTIPDDVVPNMAILDASAEIRKMQLIDPTVKRIKTPELSLSFENCTFHRIVHGSGRGTIQKELATGKAGLMDRIVEIVKSKPDEAFLFFTFKQQAADLYDCTGRMKELLTEAGVDLEVTMPDGRPQYNWLTLGNETASNSFNHVTNVVFVGVVHVPDYVLDGQIAGQLRSVDSRLNGDGRKQVELGEHAYAFHQGACRGAMRFVENDKAKPTDVYFVYREEAIEEVLKKVFPGANWNTIRLKGGAASSGAKRGQLVGLIEKVLQEKLGEKDQISSMKVKPLVRKLYTEEVSDGVFNRRFSRAAKEVSKGWKLEGRTFVQVGQ